MYPVILAALRQKGWFENAGMSQLLNNLIVILMRHQLVGRGRTGLLEIGAARTALKMNSQTDQDRIDSPYKVWKSFADLVPNDEQFTEEFKRFSDSKKDRVKYILGSIEKVASLAQASGQVIGLDDLDNGRDITIEHIIPRNPGDNWEELTKPQKDWSAYVWRLGNMILIEKNLNKEAGSKSFNHKKAVYQKSTRHEVKIVAANEKWGIENVNSRQSMIASIVVKAWPLPQGA